MDNSFNITHINKIIFISENEYCEHVLDFSGNENSNELIIHLSGDSTVLYNGERLKCKRGTVRFLPWGKAHVHKVIRNFVPDEDGDVNRGCIDIYFQSDKPVSKKAFAVDFAESKNIIAMFKRAFSLWTAKNEGYYHECLSIVYAVFAEIEKDKKYVSGDKYAHIEKAVEYINENFSTERITSEKLVSICGVSYSYIKKLFGEKFGVSPEHYILQLKLDYSCELLHNGHTVSDTSELAGFSDISYFSRIFKKKFGITPNEHRKKYVSSK